MNQLQQSIDKTRRKMHEARRLAGVMMRQIKTEKEKTNAQVEWLLDEIAAETGLKITPENMESIMTYVQEFVKDQQKRKEEADGGGESDFTDFPL